MQCAVSLIYLLHYHNLATIKSMLSNLMATLTAHFVVTGMNKPKSAAKWISVIHLCHGHHMEHCRRHSLFFSLLASSVTGTIIPQPVNSVFHRQTQALAASSCAVIFVAVIILVTYPQCCQHRCSNSAA